MKHNAAFSLGDFNALTFESCSYQFQKICNDIDLLNEQIKNQSVMVDGKSGERLMKEFHNLNQQNQ